jgi:hypothetical protein
MLEDLFDDILMFYEGNDPHGPLALWAFKRVDFNAVRGFDSRRFSQIVLTQ